jgi:hypothetical protein
MCQFHMYLYFDPLYVEYHELKHYVPSSLRFLFLVFYRLTFFYQLETLDDHESLFG